MLRQQSFGDGQQMRNAFLSYETADKASDQIGIAQAQLRAQLFHLRAVGRDRPKPLEVNSMGHNRDTAGKRRAVRGEHTCHGLRAGKHTMCAEAVKSIRLSAKQAAAAADIVDPLVRRPVHVRKDCAAARQAAQAPRQAARDMGVQHIHATREQAPQKAENGRGINVPGGIEHANLGPCVAQLVNDWPGPAHDADPRTETGRVEVANKIEHESLNSAGPTGTNDMKDVYRLAAPYSVCGGGTRSWHNYHRHRPLDWRTVPASPLRTGRALASSE